MGAPSLQPFGAPAPPSSPPLHRGFPVARCVVLAQVDVAVEEGLIQPTMRDIIVVDSDPVALLRKLRSHRLMAGTQLALDWSSKGAAAGAAKA